MTSECRCGRPTRDAAYCCDDCGTTLAKALGDVPWLTEELEISISGQKGVDYRRSGGSKGAKKPAERPSPVAWGPAEARSHLRQILVAWVRFCDDEQVRHQGGVEFPADDLSSISRWLLCRVDGLMLLEIGEEAIDEITSAVAHCHRLVDRPAERQYLGICTMCEVGRLYARSGSKWARCNECGLGIEADTIRERLLADLDDRLCTAAEIAHLSTYLGLKAGREQVRKRINQWASRNQIVEHPSMTAETTFRFGEVYAKLMVEEQQRKAG